MFERGIRRVGRIRVVVGRVLVARQQRLVRDLAHRGVVVSAEAAPRRLVAVADRPQVVMRPRSVQHSPWCWCVYSTFGVGYSMTDE